jgi:hypothetical protein
MGFEVWAGSAAGRAMRASRAAIQERTGLSPGPIDGRIAVKAREAAFTGVAEKSRPAG